MKQPIALVLSGGAARGLAHIGVIEELEEQGFEIKSIAGNSMGSLIGAMYSMGKLQEFKEWMITLDKLDVFNLIDFTFTTHGLIKGDRVFKKMKSFFPDKNIEDLKIPYVAVAADITNMKEVVFSSGSLYDAVRTSVSIPTILTPVEKNGITLVDGGVVNPIPLDKVKRFEGDILVGSYVNANIPYEKPILSKEEEENKTSIYKERLAKYKIKLNSILSKSNKEKLNYFKLLDKSTSMLTNKVAVMNIEKHKPNILINISKHSANTFDFFKTEELIEAGRLSAKKSIEEYKSTQIKTN